MAVGASFLVFAFTLRLNVVLTGKEIPVLWIHRITAYLIVGGLILIASVALFASLVSSERKELGKIFRLVNY